MNCDTIYLQDRLPDKGETFFARSASVIPGGKGGNQAVQLSKLGIKTYMVAKIGNDNYGSLLKAELEGYGVDTSYVLTGSGTTGLAAVLTMPDGVYYSTVASGTNNEMVKGDVETVKELIQGAAVTVFQNEITREATEYAITLAHDSGVYIILNAAPAREMQEDVLKMVGCLIVNETEASFYLGHRVDSIDCACKYGPQLRERIGGTLIITLGSNGSVLCTDQGCTHYEADKNIKAIETTGSGDSYVGAFAYMKAKGATDDQSCRFASLVSQYTVTHIGGQPSMPYWDDVAEAWEKENQGNKTA